MFYDPLLSFLRGLLSSLCKLVVIYIPTYHGRLLGGGGARALEVEHKNTICEEVRVRG